MMEKKQLLENVLKELVWVRDKAQILIDWLKEDKLDEVDIDELLEIITQIVHQYFKEEKKQILLEQIEKIKQIALLEKESKKADLIELKRLEKMLEDLMK